MTGEYSLWKVTFSYEAPGDHARNRERNVYVVPALDKDEAESKSLAHFSKTDAYTDLDLSREGLVRTTATEIKKQKITLPELTLAEDQEHFFIIPRLSTDGRSLEYLVTEKKGR
ncbi:MAG: hypothetical protein Q7S55_05095 [Nanoarchaeota archaeon]|nr:hypothetical protein [Nanoarchaeota archaeon]